MSTQNSVTLTGNLTADPELRTVAGDIPVARLRLAVNRRAYDASSASWTDRVDGFFTVSCWRDQARHAAVSLRKGDRVVVSGRLTSREYEVTVGTEAQTRHVTEIEADEIAGSLRWDSWQRVERRPIAVLDGAAGPATADDADGTDADDRPSGHHTHEADGVVTPAA